MFSYYLKKYTTPFFLISFILFLFSLISLVVFILRPDFADAVNLTVAQGVRLALAKVTSLLPFSLAEILICLSPLILAVLLICLFLFCNTSRQRRHFLLNILGVFALVGTIYVFTLGVGYHTTRLDDKLDLERESLSSDELLSTCKHLRDMLESELDNVAFDENGSSVMPYTMDELSALLSREYTAFCESRENKNILRFNYSSRCKGVYFSRAMSYLHILGIYTFFTGEANVNVDYPDVEIPATTAHEMAHQRGISREDEANFIAFLIAKNSSDAYLRYSGYLDMFRYVTNALYRADREMYKTFIQSVDGRIIRELVAISEHSKQYQDTVVGDISTSLNDAYLKANGTEGSVSYGFVVDLVVAYYKSQTPTLFE